MTNIDQISSEKLHINICVCTYRRAYIAETLRSLSQLLLRPNWQVDIIVADNDDTPSAKELVEITAKSCKLSVRYIHAPVRNISVARNACLAAANAPLVAFIDDDELATPGWLTNLVVSLENSKADVVLGPVVALYSKEYPEWMKKGDFHSTRPVWVDGRIITGYTCNVLFQRTSPKVAGLKFELSLGQTGGEDTAFFSEVCKFGGQITFASDAIVTELVKPNRANFPWLLKRYFRSGQTHALLLLKNGNSSLLARSKNISVALYKALFCYANAPLYISSSDQMRFWLLRGTLHLGVVAKLLGKKELQQYG